MFDRLRKAFSRAAKGIAQKELTEKVLDDVLLDLQIALLESDVAEEVVDELSAKLKNELLGVKLDKEQEAVQLVETKFRKAVAEIFSKATGLDLIDKIRTKKENNIGPFVIVFLGINGTGKTTTVAKIANLLRKAGFSMVVAAGDTHRAGAIEQLEQHTNRLSLKIVKQRYGADPSSVGRDAYDHAKKNHIDIVLMDTAGRMQTSKNLMDEMGKIVRVVKPDLKLFIGDALAGNDTINQAREFFEYTNFDGAILTKVDADAKGGAAISIAHITSKPIIYIGVGQGYDDIIPFDSDKFIASIFEGVGEISVNRENMAYGQQTSELSVEKIVSEDVREPQKKEEKEDTVLLSEITAPPLSRAGNASKEDHKVEPPSAEPSVEQPELHKVKDQVKQKKSRFGFFGRKKEKERTAEEGKHSEEKIEEEHKVEMRDEVEEEEKEEEEQSMQIREKENQVQEGKHSEEQNEEKDKVVYLTDEDIEDLLK
jgi:fused signal recognition particle receptor